ncbi:MAG: hypothetical protein ACYTGB_15170 [Planctomycetota bacterium]|jgi:hypothetical protein
MEKFKLQEGETVLKKAGGTFFPEETKEMGAFKAAFKAKMGVVFLTSARVAVCTKLVEFPWGVLVWAIRAMLGRKIYHQVQLETVKRLETKEDNQQFVITSADGSEFILAFDSFFDSRAKWLEAIADAIAAADPNAKLDRQEKVVDVTRA